MRDQVAGEISDYMEALKDAADAASTDAQAVVERAHRAREEAAAIRAWSMRIQRKTASLARARAATR